MLYRACGATRPIPKFLVGSEVMTMATLSRFLIGIAAMLVGFHLASIFFDPLFDIAHNSLNESVANPPPLSFYIYRSISVYKTPFAPFLFLFGVLLGYARFLTRKKRIGIIIFFMVPCLLSLISLIYISITDISEQGGAAILQGIIRAVDFIAPFVLAWLMASPIAKGYEKITGESFS